MSNIVFFKGNKYDITDFISNHPGGSVINKAIGKNLEDVWKENGVDWHLTNSRVMDTLESYKVGSTNETFLNNSNNSNNFNKLRRTGIVLFDLVILFCLIILFLRTI